MRVIARVLATTVILWLSMETAFACGPFVGIRRVPTVREETRKAKVVFLCTMKNARMTDNLGGGQTDMVLEKVFKGGEHLKGKKVIVLDRYIPSKKNEIVKYIVFCDFFKSVLDPYQGTRVDNAQYYEKALATAALAPAKRLAYFFKNLENTNADIALDALREFRNTDYKHARTMAKSMRPEVFVQRLAKAKGSPEKTRVYATLLGDCGTKAHAAVLETHLAEQEKQKRFVGTEGLLVGLLLLDAERGWKRIRRLLRDREAKFLVRWSAMNAVQFLRDNRPEIVSGNKAAEMLALLLPDPSMADLAVSDLRRHGRWEMTGAVLALYGKKSYHSPIIQRAVLRFALQCPRPGAKQLIATVRQADRQLIEDLEESLRLAGK